VSPLNPLLVSLSPCIEPAVQVSRLAHIIRREVIHRGRRSRKGRARSRSRLTTSRTRDPRGGRRPAVTVRVARHLRKFASAGRGFVCKLAWPPACIECIRVRMHAAMRE
jgi:hypothetical protein